MMHASPLNFENGSLFGRPVVKQPVQGTKTLFLEAANLKTLKKQPTQQSNPMHTIRKHALGKKKKSHTPLSKSIFFHFLLINNTTYERENFLHYESNGSEEGFSSNHGWEPGSF